MTWNRQDYVEYDLYCKYTRLAAKAGSKAKRRQFLSRAGKYHRRLSPPRKKRSWLERLSPEEVAELVETLLEPLRKGVLANDILNDIYEVEPLPAGACEAYE